MLTLCLLLALQDRSGVLAEQLRSDRAEERDRAMRELLKLGEAAVPIVEPLIHDADVEVAWRARMVFLPHSAPMAEGLWQRLEQRLLEARSLRFKVRIESGGVVLATGEVRIRGGAVNAWIRDPRPEKESFASIRSDGTRVLVERSRPVTLNWNNAAPAVDRDAPPGLGPEFIRCFARVGIQTTLSACSNLLAGGGKWDLTSTLKARSHRMLFIGDWNSGIGFQVPVAGNLLEQQLTVQPGKDTVTSRRVLQGGTLVLTEIYDEFVLNEDLPAGPFQLPAGK